MRKLLIVLICILTISAFGQKTKKVSKTNSRESYTEKYRVLKSDKNIKHGSYKKIDYVTIRVGASSSEYDIKHTTNMTMSEISGYYKLGKKDSIWTYYFGGSKQIRKQGKFQSGKMIGEWNYYSIVTKEIIQTYDYTLQKLIYSRPPKRDYVILKDGKEITTKLVSAPQFIGSTKELLSYITPGQREIVKSNDYDLKSGFVFISFFISPEGKAINHKIERGISDKVNNKCLEIVKSIPDNWIPGKDENGPVTSKYRIPIRFKVNE